MVHPMLQMRNIQFHQQRKYSVQWVPSSDCTGHCFLPGDWTAVGVDLLLSGKLLWLGHGHHARDLALGCVPKGKQSLPPSRKLTRSPALCYAFIFLLPLNTDNSSVWHPHVRRSGFLHLPEPWSLWPTLLWTRLLGVSSCSHTDGWGRCTI